MIPAAFTLVPIASCHNPHAAPGAKLWNFGVTRRGALCTVCHRSLVGG